MVWRAGKKAYKRFKFHPPHNERSDLNSAFHFLCGRSRADFPFFHSGCQNFYWCQSLLFNVHVYTGLKWNNVKVYVTRRNTTCKLHFNSTLVVMSHESNTFFVSASFAFAWGGLMQTWVEQRHTCDANTGSTKICLQYKHTNCCFHVTMGVKWGIQCSIVSDGRASYEYWLTSP